MAASKTTPKVRREKLSRFLFVQFCKRFGAPLCVSSLFLFFYFSYTHTHTHNHSTSLSLPACPLVLFCLNHIPLILIQFIYYNSHSTLSPNMTEPTLNFHIQTHQNQFKIPHELIKRIQTHTKLIEKQRKQLIDDISKIKNVKPHHLVLN